MERKGEPQNQTRSVGVRKEKCGDGFKISTGNKVQIVL